jgi:DNA-binding transcriptional ArsR family regulator
MTDESTRPLDAIRVIDDAETLRLIADPLRLRLLELMRQQPRTVSELAELLEVPRTKLYYHMKLLEEHDLITVDTTRIVSGIVEKRYRVTAYRLTIDKTILGSPDSGDAPLDVFLSVVLDEVASEIRRAVRSGLIDLDQTHLEEIAPRQLMIGRSWFRFTPDQVMAFRDRYDQLLSEFADCIAPGIGELPPDPDNPGSELYEWLIAFYPTVPPVEWDQE